MRHFLLAMLALVLVLGSIMVWIDNRQMHKGYEAWVKLTGNEKHLTFDEWSAYVNSTKSRDTTVYPIYIQH